MGKQEGDTGDTTGDIMGELCVMGNLESEQEGEGT